MQQPVGGIWGNVTMTGVPVYVYAIDPNGNYKDIGIATTEAYYGTFSIPFTPEVEGTYTIMASFGGDVSYGSSGASTAVFVGPAPTVAPTTEPPQAPPDYMPMMYAILAAVVIAIIIGLIALFRKR